MMMLLKNTVRLLIAYLIVNFAGTQKTWSSDEVKSVVVLANSNDAGSVEIANYYAEKRSIPLENVIALPMPTRETISVRKYVDELHNPLLNALIEKGWVRVAKAREPDSIGRGRVLAGIHRISYLVTTRGVPLRIAKDLKLLDILRNRSDGLMVNNGSVDGELALLIGPSDSTMVGFVPNPLFAYATSSSTDRNRVIHVSRLDGPDVTVVKRLIDRTLKAEFEGLMGRAYFDMRGLDIDNSSYGVGDKWMRSASELAKNAFFDTDCETTNRLMDETDRFDVPAIYMGWYHQHVYGPWSKKRWPVPPGAIGFHLYSGSAATVRSASRGWLGAFVNQGYCATMGNVYEPYLNYTHHPDILLGELLKGRTFGEAVMLSNPVLSWQGVAIGDPLYRPFKTSLRAQLQSTEGSPLAAYVYLREINRLLAEGNTDGALQFAQTQFRKNSSLPLVYKLAQLYADQGNTESALKVLKMVSTIDVFAVDEWMLMKKIADFLSNQEEYSAALDLYKKLLDQKGLSRIQQVCLFEDGAAIALRQGDTKLSVKWLADAENLK